MGRIKPLMDRVLIKKIQAPKKTTGGLYLPESAQKYEIPQGLVTAVGPGALNQDGVKCQCYYKKAMKCYCQIMEDRNLKLMMMILYCFENQKLSQNWRIQNN